jgi:hypothetical protein
MRLLAVVIVLAGLVACKPATAVVPPGPNSPQTQVANIDKTLADAVNAAVKTTIALRDQGKVSQANTVVIENWCKAVATADDAIATELGSTDTWAVQKQKILLMVVNQAVPLATANLDPSLAAALNGVANLISQIQQQVSQ